MLMVPHAYRFDEAEAEVRRVISEMPGHDLKQLAAGIGMPYKQLVRALKRSEGRDFLNIETLGLVAAYVTRFYRPTPPGWPLVTFAAYEHLLQLVRDSMTTALKPTPSTRRDLHPGSEPTGERRPPTAQPAGAPRRGHAPR